MLKYDLHIHTKYSKCSNLKPEILLKIAKKRGLNGIAVTDHNTMEGAFRTKKLNKDKDFEVILAEEVSTKQGDIVAYYIKKPIKAGDFFDVADEIKKQDGLIAIAHPFRTALVPGHRFKLPLREVKNRIDAVECFNSRMLIGDNEKADKTANKLNLAKTGGSDGHFKFEIGKAYTIFENNLRKALKNKKTKVNGTILYGSFGGILSFLRKRIY